MTIRVMSRFVRVAGSALLALAVASSAVAGCLPGHPKPTEDMACCKMGDHDCGPAMRADCCKPTSSNAEKFIATKPAPTAKPIIALSYLATVTLAGLTSSPRTAATFAPPPSASPPLFLLISSLRI